MTEKRKVSSVLISDLENRFNFHPATNDKTKEAHETIRGLCKALALDINTLVPDGREKSLAMTKLEEVMMWANAGVARSVGNGS